MAGTAAMSAAGLVGIGSSRAEVAWKKFAGTTLEVNLTKSPRGDTLQKFQSEFEALTGIKVNSEQTPEQQARQKTTIELSSGKPSFDVVHMSYHVQKRQFEKAGWLADLTPCIKDPTLTEDSFVENDFAAAGLAFARDRAGRIGALPLSVDYFIVYWNKALFAAKNLEFPTTFEEMVRAAEKLTDPGDGKYGFVARGMKNANVPIFTSLMLGWDKDSVGADGTLNTDGPEAVEAAKLYQRLLSKSAPKGITGFNWAECQSAFLQGNIGMWMDGAGFAPPIEDPTKSRVVGKVGYGVIPKGPLAQGAGTTGDGIGVVAATTKKEAAYLYCKWAVSKLIGSRMLQAGAGVPFRNSVLNDPDVIKGVTMPKGWVDCVAGSSKVSRLALPVIVPVTEFRDIIGVALTNMIGGADPAAELKRATAEFKPIYDKSEAG
jgi:multiple sugar transport system substrate-binding protein